MFVVPLFVFRFAGPLKNWFPSHFVEEHEPRTNPFILERSWILEQIFFTSSNTGEMRHFIQFCVINCFLNGEDTVSELGSLIKTTHVPHYTRGAMLLLTPEPHNSLFHYLGLNWSTHDACKRLCSYGGIVSWNSNTSNACYAQISMTFIVSLHLALWPGMSSCTHLWNRQHKTIVAREVVTTRQPDLLQRF